MRVAGAKKVRGGGGQGEGCSATVPPPEGE